MRETLDEARAFLNEPIPIPRIARTATRKPERDASGAADRLYSLSRPVPGTLAETYLRGRGITARLDWPSLRFHPACYYREYEDAPLESWPALLGVVTDLDGRLTGLQRTWLARDGSGKAPFEEPRRAMGRLLGHAVRFGTSEDVLAAGEGIETVLSLLSLFPALPMIAGLLSAHLAAILFPPGLRRLYCLRDNDSAGDFAEHRLGERAREAGHRVSRPDPRRQGSQRRSPQWSVRSREAKNCRAAGAGRPRPCYILALSNLDKYILYKPTCKI